MQRLEIIDHNTDHIIVSTDEPARFEISLTPGGRIILHGYVGAESDTEQDPGIVYDGDHAEKMIDTIYDHHLNA